MCIGPNLPHNIADNIWKINTTWQFASSIWWPHNSQFHLRLENYPLWQGAFGYQTPYFTSICNSPANSGDWAHRKRTDRSRILRTLWRTPARKGLATCQRRSLGRAKVGLASETWKPIFADTIIRLRSSQHLRYWGLDHWLRTRSTVFWKRHSPLRICAVPTYPAYWIAVSLIGC